jgi:hypothetical protein
MPRIDAFGVQHITGDDEITGEGLDHVEGCCGNAFPEALYFARERSAAFTPNANNANANADVQGGVRAREESSRG